MGFKTAKNRYKSFKTVKNRYEFQNSKKTDI